MELPNTHAQTYEDTRTHTPREKKVERVKKKENGGKGKPKKEEGVRQERKKRK